MEASTLLQVIKDKIKAAIPKITAKDLKALDGLNAEELQDVLNDYIKANKVNQSDLDKLVQFAKDAAPTAELLFNIAKMAF